MKLKLIIDEDFTNYKKASMFIGTISCTGKCCKEAGIPISICQNNWWRNQPVLVIKDDDICKRYLENDLTSAIVFGGLEPIEQFPDLVDFLDCLRNKYSCDDDVVIYTGYTDKEISKQISILKKFSNIVIKFGRYLPNSPSRYDKVLGVNLASENQYGERIS